MARLFIICSILLLTTLSMTAQVKKGFKLLENQDYAQALAIFEAETKQADNSVPAGYGILKAATGLEETSVWIHALTGYDKTISGFNAAPESAKANWEKAYKINKNELELAYNGLFSKTLSHVEKNISVVALRDSFMNSVSVIPAPYKARFNKLMIDQQENPLTKRSRMDVRKKSTKMPVYVERNAPEGSRLEFVRGINTAGSEYVPVISSDGKIMYLVGEGRVDNYKGEDVFYTERNPDGSWAAPKIDPFFSGDLDEAVVSISADGNNLVLFIHAKPYLSNRTGTGWSEPMPIQLQKNFIWIGMTSITRNGEALIFEARERMESDIDIYVALRKKQGWDIPFALGSPVKSDENDRTPFLHSDFKTLYFSSNGHGGAGGMDVFKTTRLDDTWKNWSTPENLGSNVNTPRDEVGFCIPPAGNLAYLATKVPGFTDQDIMRIPLDLAARPEAQVMITGTLKDGSGKTVKGEIMVEDAATKKVMQTVATQPNGNYSFSIPKTAKINYYAKGDQLISTRKTYVDAATYTTEVAEEKVDIITATEASSGGNAIELQDLLFDFGKAELRPDAQSELKRIFEDIKGFNWNIEIGGHTDNIGSAQSNLQLSTRRAQTVRDFLVAQGYPASRISFKGYGSNVPLDKAETDAARMRNRRVEIRVLKQ